MRPGDAARVQPEIVGTGDVERHLRVLASGPPDIDQVAVVIGERLHLPGRLLLRALMALLLVHRVTPTGVLLELLAK